VIGKLTLGEEVVDVPIELGESLGVSSMWDGVLTTLVVV
jgi:hypothetical protein